MAKLSRIVASFARDLNERYRAGTWSAVECFYAYLGFLYKFGGEDIRELVDWQVRDMIAAIENAKVDYRIETLEILWVRSRRSGKTMCATILAIFYVLLGYRVRWFTPGKGQMKAARMWFKQNPFFVREVKSEHAFHVVGEKHALIWNVLASHQQVTGDECDCLFYDEGGDVEKDLKVYENYEDSRPFVANSDFAHILHFSTPARFTALHEAKENLERLERERGTQLIFVRDWTWCPWTKRARVRAEADRHPEDPYFIQKNYKCRWVVYGGAIFTEGKDFIDVRDAPPELQRAWEEMEATHGGVDWNGEATQHYLVPIAFTDKVIFVKDEIKFWGFNALKDVHRDIHLELESDDPFSNRYADDALEEGVLGAYVGWDDELKMEKVRQVKKRLVVVDKAVSQTLWRNLQEAAYDRKKRLPTLEKRPDQHGLDALLHAMHEVPDEIYHIGRRDSPRVDVPTANNPFGRRDRGLDMY